MKIKVLIVDDSALIRSLLSEIIRQDPALELIGTAPNAFIAKDMVQQFKPDVITLDIEMPKVDGLTFLDRLMKARPTPVLMISTLTEKGADATLKALELGAVDFIPKPQLNVTERVNAYQEEILAKIKVISKIKLAKKINATTKPVDMPMKYKGTEIVVGIGASTGGTEAIKRILSTLPSTFPAILITLHMPANFTQSFAKRLDNLSRMTVQEAKDDQRLQPGNVYLAPGNKHLEMKRKGEEYRIVLTDGALVSGHKPAVDVMFASMAKHAGKHCIATLLTGMGKDGVRGMIALKKTTATTFAQDEESSVVYGMPKAAVECGAVDKVVALDEMASTLVNAVNRRG